MMECLPVGGIPDAVKLEMDNSSLDLKACIDTNKPLPSYTPATDQAPAPVAAAPAPSPVAATPVPAPVAAAPAPSPVAATPV